MSGTSIDGIDVALIETDGEQVFDIGPANTILYSASLERSIRASLGQRVMQAYQRYYPCACHCHKNPLSRYPEYKENSVWVYMDIRYFMRLDEGIPSN